MHGFDIELYARNLSEDEHARHVEAWMLDDDGKPDATKRPLYRCRLIQVCLCERNGVPVYSDNGDFTDAGLQEIKNLPSDLTRPAGDFILKLNGIGGEQSDHSGN